MILSVYRQPPLKDTTFKMLIINYVCQIKKQFSGWKNVGYKANFVQRSFCINIACYFSGSAPGLIHIDDDHVFILQRYSNLSSGDVGHRSISPYTL